MSPVEFGRVCREQLSHYPNIEFRPGEIVRAERHDDQLEVIHSDGAVHYVKTCVPGVFAAGNASTGLQLVIIAAAEGTRAAFAINEMLVEKERRVRP
jgi:thioredoxin reductase